MRSLLLPLVLAGALGAVPAGRGTAGEAQSPPKAVPAVFKALSADEARRAAALVGQLGDPAWRQREAASKALAEIGEGAVPGLLRAAGSADEEVAYRVRHLLKKLVPRSRIYRLLRSRRAPKERIDELGGPEKALPVLTACMGLPKAAAPYGLAHRAAALLGHCGKPAAPVLTAVLAGPDAEARAAAAAALAEIGPGAAGAVPALEKALGDEHSPVRQGAARALGAVGSAAGKAAPALKKALEDKQPWVRYEAALALRRVRGGKAGEEVLPVLSKLLEDKDRNLRASVASALGKLGPAARPAVPALAKALEDRRNEVRQAALTALGEIGPAAKEALPALEKLLAGKRTSAALRFQAQITKMRITGQTDQAVAELTRALSDRNWSVRRLAADALGELGPAAKTAVPELEKLLKDRNKHLRRAAAGALEKIRGRKEKAAN